MKNHVALVALELLLSGMSVCLGEQEVVLINNVLFEKIFDTNPNKARLTQLNTSLTDFLNKCVEVSKEDAKGMVYSLAIWRDQAEKANKDKRAEFQRKYRLMLEEFHMNKE